MSQSLFLFLLVLVVVVVAGGTLMAPLGVAPSGALYGVKDTSVLVRMRALSFPRQQSNTGIREGVNHKLIDLENMPT